MRMRKARLPPNLLQAQPGGSKYCRLLYDSNASTVTAQTFCSCLLLKIFPKLFLLEIHKLEMAISTALKYLGITILLAIIMNPDKIYLHCSLFSNEEISEELMDYIKQQLLFVDDPTDRTVQQLLPLILLKDLLAPLLMLLNNFTSKQYKTKSSCRRPDFLFLSFHRRF